MDESSEYVSRMETQLKRWDADVDAAAPAGTRKHAGMKVAWETMQKALEKVSRDLGK
jgi:hypothetical protein